MKEQLRRAFEKILKRETKKILTRYDLSKYKHFKSIYSFHIRVNTFTCLPRFSCYWEKNCKSLHNHVVDINTDPLYLTYKHGDMQKYIRSHRTTKYIWVHYKKFAPKNFYLKDVWGIIIEYYGDDDDKWRTTRETIADILSLYIQSRSKLG